MLLGAVLALRSPPAVEATKLRHWLILVMLLIAYVICKFSMVKGWKLPGTEIAAPSLHVLLFLLTAIILWFSFQLATSHRFLTVLKSARWLWLLPVLISSLTLEIYLTHIFVLKNQALQQLVFSVNVLLFFLISIVLSWLVGKGSGYLRGLILRTARRANGHRGTTIEK